MKSPIRIASGQGFWGDLPSAPVAQVRKGPIDYLVMDYLAEVTMSIMQKQKQRDPRTGYARDLVPLLAEILPDLVSRKITVITNGGGVNPFACRDAVMEVARSKGIRVTIGVVLGDDILGRLDEMVAAGTSFDNMETGTRFGAIRNSINSANVYFGAIPIVEALRLGANIVITGRTTDTGLTLAPMIHEFGWNDHDWHRLAAGTIAGHILECGAQASGGNFSADWRSVPDLAHIGFPIAEAYPDGRFIVTKHEGTGGLVSEATVKEQLLYEIGDPCNYITPDCVADFTSIQLRQCGADRVEVEGIQGRASTEYYKVSMAYHAGYTAFGSLTYAWPDALEKARTADAIIRTRLADGGATFDEIRTEFLGYNSCFGPRLCPAYEPEEVVLRIGVRTQRKDSIEIFSREIAPLVLTGPPSVTGFAGGRPKGNDVIAYWPALIRKSLVRPQVDVVSS